MSEQQLQAFLDQVRVDSGLQEKLNTADPDSVVAIAQEAGLVTFAEGLMKPQVEISESELEHAIGGFCIATQLGPVNVSK